MEREKTTVGLVIGVLLIAAVSVPMVAAGGGVTRMLPEAAAPGSTITVSLDVKVDGATTYSIDEQVPSGWTVTSASEGGDFTSEPGHVKWIKVMGVVNTTLTYNVVVPEEALGLYTFNGIYMLEGMTEEATIGGDSSITVTTADITPPAIDFIAPTPADGSNVTVDYITINVSVTDPSNVVEVLLNWNGVNETMYMTADNTWSVNKDDLPDETYLFQVYANDTYDNEGVSEVRRTVIVSSSAYDPADTDHDRIISMPELMTAISWWKAGTYTMPELMTTIARWKAGGY